MSKFVSADAFISSLGLLDPEASIPAQEILIALRNLQEDLVAAQQENDALRSELETKRRSIVHLEDVLLPKYEEHAMLCRENEAKLKAMLSKMNGERASLSSEVSRLTARLRIVSQESSQYLIELRSKTEEAGMLEASLTAVRSETEAAQRHQTKTAVADAVTAAVAAVRAECDSRIRAAETMAAQARASADALLSAERLDAQRQSSSAEAAVQDLAARRSALEAEVAAARVGTDAAGKHAAELAAQCAALSADLAASRTRTAELERARAGEEAAAADAATRERARADGVIAAQRDYTLHLTHVISVLEAYIARSLRAGGGSGGSGSGPQYGAFPLQSHVQMAPQQAQQQQQQQQNHQQHQQQQRRAKADECAHYRPPLVPSGSVSFASPVSASVGAEAGGVQCRVKPLRCLAELADFDGCCHQLKHAGLGICTAHGHGHGHGHGHRGPGAARAGSPSRSRSRSRGRIDASAPAPTSGPGGVAGGSALGVGVRPEWRPSSGSPEPLRSAKELRRARLQQQQLAKARGTAGAGSGASSGSWDGARALAAAAPATTGSVPQAPAPSFLSITRGLYGSAGSELGASAGTGGETTSAAAAAADTEAAATTIGRELARLRAAYAQAVADLSASRGGSHSASVWEARHDPDFTKECGAEPDIKSLLQQIERKQALLYQSHANATADSVDT
jgi:uncharacterized protein YqiB (DUF1249 family)